MQQNNLIFKFHIWNAQIIIKANNQKSYTKLSIEGDQGV